MKTSFKKCVRFVGTVETLVFVKKQGGKSKNFINIIDVDKRVCIND